MAEAFEPKKYLFMHVCRNCEYGKEVTESGGSALRYICILKDGAQRLTATHKCDEQRPDDKDQINCFDEIRSEK